MLQTEYYTKNGFPECEISAVHELYEFLFNFDSRSLIITCRIKSEFDTYYSHYALDGHSKGTNMDRAADGDAALKPSKKVSQCPRKSLVSSW